jgi:DNA repair exonuclease SbcCD ATPase subunit
MYFNSLKINNFKRIKKADLEFGKINIFFGENYSGKSSIISALVYIYTNYLEDKIQNYVRWETSGFNLNAIIEDKNNLYDYSIKYAKSTDKTLIVNNKDKYINSEASKKFASIIDPNLAFYSSVSLQGKSTNVIFDSPTDRANTLKTILGLDKLLEISELLKKDISIKENRENVLKSEITILENSKYIYMTIPDIIPIDDIISQFEILEEEKKVYENSLRKYHLYLDQVIQFKKVKEQITVLENQIDSMTSEIGSLQLKLLPEIEFDINLLLDVNNQISSLNKEKHNYDIKLSEISKYSEKKQYIQNQITHKETENENLVLSRIKTLSFSQENIYSLLDELKSHQAELNILNKHKTLFSSGKCPTCDQPYHGDINKLNADIEQHKSEIIRISNLIDSMQKELNAYNQVIENRKIISSKKETLSKEIESLNLELNAVTTQIEKLQSVLVFNEEEYQSKLNKLLLEQEIFTKKQLEVAQIKQANQNNNNHITRLTNLIQANQTTIASLKNNQEPVEVKEPISYNKEMYLELQKQINIYESDLQSRQKAIEHNTLIEQKERENTQLLESLKNELDLQYTQIEILKSSKNLVDKDMSPYFLESGVTDIVSIMNHIFTKIHPEYEISIKQEKKNLEFFYNYTDSKGDKVPVSILMASGFERQIVSLCFKLALTILSGTRILFLDETDSDAKDTNSIIFYDRLLESSILDQVFIISLKEETVKHIVDNFNAKCFYINNGEITKVIN